MTLKIILTSYFLTYMYGNRAYEDPLLLSREVIKKAYNEGLYYISSKENINNIKNAQRTIYVFAGIPTFQEVCLYLQPNSQLHALRIKVPYEKLASVTYDEEEHILLCQDIDVQDSTSITLNLQYQNKNLCYLEEERKFIPDKSEVLDMFHKDIETYHYVIKTNVEYLKESLVTFLNDKEITDESILEKIKACYEMLC